jgi:hypothetical protein
MSASLTKLKVSAVLGAGAIPLQYSPVFNPAIKAYSIKVPFRYSELTVVAETNVTTPVALACTTCTVSPDSKILLQPDTNIVKISTGAAETLSTTALYVVREADLPPSTSTFIYQLSSTLRFEDTFSATWATQRGPLILQTLATNFAVPLTSLRINSVLPGVLVDFTLTILNNQAEVVRLQGVFDNIIATTLKTALCTAGFCVPEIAVVEPLAPLCLSFC